MRIFQPTQLYIISVEYQVVQLYRRNKVSNFTVIRGVGVRVLQHTNDIDFAHGNFEALTLVGTARLGLFPRTYYETERNTCTSDYDHQVSFSVGEPKTAMEAHPYIETKAKTIKT